MLYDSKGHQQYETESEPEPENGPWHDPENTAPRTIDSAFFAPQLTMRTKYNIARHTVEAIPSRAKRRLLNGYFICPP